MKTIESAKPRGARMERRIMAGLGLMAAAAIPLSALPAAAQQESQDWRHQTVMERPRDQFDPKGIPLGSGFRFFPSVDVGELYTDNLYARETGARDDFATVIAPKFSIESNWSRHKLTLGGFAQIYRYLDTPTEDSEDYGGDAALALDLAHGGSLGLSAGYNHTTIERGNPEEAGRIEPEVANITTAKIDWGQRFSFLLLGARAQLMNFNEASSLDADKNRSEYTGAFRVGYVFSPSFNTFVEPFYTLRDFDLATDFRGVDRDSDVMGISAGMGYDITGLLYGETKVGWYRATFRDPNTKSDSGISIESKTTWNVTPRNTFILNIARQNIITNEPGSSSRVVTGAGLEYQHELRRNILLHLTISYAQDEFVQSIPKRTDDRIEGGVRVDYLLNRYLALYLRYARTDVNSTINTEDYVNNLIMIGIRTQI